jgi:hypothetical protein
MQEEHDLSKKILALTTLIKEQHPELIKYIAEMPETIPNDESPVINVEELTLYYESLQRLIEGYQEGREIEITRDL